MNQVVELSDELVEDARTIGEAFGRSVAEQIDFWTQLGRVTERFLDGSRAVALRNSAVAVPLSKLFASVDTPEGRQRLAEYLQSQPYPHFEAADAPGLLVRIDADGTRTIGRFLGREFRAVE